MSVYLPISYHMRSSRITQAALPRLNDLIKGMFITTPSKESLSATWSRLGDVTHWFSRSAWSITVIAGWRQRMVGKPSVTVWVPDFFCNESLELLRAMGAKLIFYAIDEHSHPAAGQFPTVTEDNRPDLFLLVHYFGEPAPCAEALAFCRAHGAWLVEDAAHVLVPITGVGEAGDIVLYSPHKHLAIPDGAILIIRKDGPSALAMQVDQLSVLDAVVADTFDMGKPFDKITAVWLAKRLAQMLGFRSRQKLPPFAPDIQTTSAVTDPPEMSPVARRLLNIELTRLPERAANRRKCAINWASTLRSVYSVNHCEVLPVSHTPYLACIVAPDQATAKTLYEELHSVGVPVSTWPDLPPEVGVSAVGHVTAMRFRHTRIYLPVHNAVDSLQITSYGKKLRDLIQTSWRMRQIESLTEWERLWLSCKRKSLPQTWEYGSAKATAEGWRAQRYVVLDENNAPIALFQVLVKGLRGLGGVARVNRGPLMLRDEPNRDNRLALCVIAILVREARRQRWMMQIAPLLPPDPVVESALISMGFRKQSNCPMDSALLSLDGSEDQLMMGLNGKWRNCLRKGQKLGVKVEIDTGGRHKFQSLLDFYKIQQLKKRFEGTSNKMLRALADNTSELFKFNLFVAMDGTDITGVLVTLQFGDVSEYLIGATNDKGRTNQANSVLLWEAILDAKRNGCHWFDVGGLAKSTPKGIANFKRGLNAEPYGLVGEWRRWL